MDRGDRSKNHRKPATTPSGIITLISDFGLRDHYVAMMKGVILSINPDVRLVDISHLIGVGSVFQASRLICETFHYFPEGTVHMAVVDPSVGSKRRLIGLEAEAHFFVGPDNGIFWPVIKDHKGKIVHLTESRYFLPPVSHTFHGREIFAPVAAHLSLGVDLEIMGMLIKDPVELNLPSAYIDEGILTGQIIRVDNFGNLITNIHRTEFERFIDSAQPVIEVGNLVVKGLSRIYADTEEGKPLALINSSNWLEIAIDLGRASEYIGVDSEEIIGTAVKVGKSG
jgi:S-adenosylmethionine hydrolase